MSIKNLFSDRNRPAISAAVFVFSCAVYLSGLLIPLDGKLSDYAAARRKYGGRIMEVAIVEITDECLQKISPWPFKRSVLAAGIEKLMTAGSNTLALCVPIPSRSDPGEDYALRSTLEKHSKNIILPAEIVEKNAAARGDASRAAVEKVLLKAFCQDQTGEGGFAVTNISGARISEDESLKAVPLFAETLADSTAPVAIMGLTAAVRYLGRQITGLPLPAAAEDFFINYYAGPADSPFVKLSFSKLIEMDTDEVADMACSRLVFIAPSTTSNAAWRRTPFGLMSESEIHATIAANIIKSEYALRVPIYATLLLLALACIICDIYLAASMEALDRLKKSLGGMVVKAAADAAFYSAAAFGVYIVWDTLLKRGLFMDAFALMLLVSVQMLAVRFYHSFIFMSEEEKIKDLQKKFGAMIKRYVSNSTYESVMSSAARGSVAEAERREMTVLFADIVSFTTLSEKRDAAEIVEMLNDFFTFASYVIQRNRGDIDKFIGDCVMATFIDSADAVRAARELLDEGIPKLNGLLASKSLPPIGVRIGINTGELIRGDIGSDIRKDMTVIGDTVNTASRIQSEANPGSFAVSESTLKSSGATGLSFAREILLKGKSVPTRIYMPKESDRL